MIAVFAVSGLRALFGFCYGGRFGLFAFSGID